MDLSQNSEYDMEITQSQSDTYVNINRVHLKFRLHTSLIVPAGVIPLSLTGSLLSNTDLSDLSTVGICDIFVYKMRHGVM